MDYKEEDCIRETKEHIAQVREFMLMFALELVNRASVHDNSKLESPELEVFTEYTPRLKNTTYGSDEYKASLEGMKVALDHHYANNSHHPEYYHKFVCAKCSKEFKEKPSVCDNCYSYVSNEFREESGISQMDLADIVEMICDWKAATMRHKDGDIDNSILINKKRFKYSDDMAKIFTKTVKMFES